jgi:hypothetical protein
MSSSLNGRTAALAAGALLFSAVAVPAAAAGPVSVTVNGTTLNLNPPPTERAGRVFVPLRGVFENLGATVVYADGTINATGRGHSVSLHIGSQQAVVDGQPQTLDVAPFIIGASTYVPLRFVSQALGAAVNYDGTNDIVAIVAPGQGGPPPGGPPPAMGPGGPPQGNPNPNMSPVTLGNLLPRRDATIGSNRPTIQASFENGAVDPNSVRIELDGRDVTDRAYISDRGVTYTPPSLPPAQHTVQIRGQDSAGATFVRRWSFTSGGGGSTANAIERVSPHSDSTVGDSFIVRGRTMPGSTVTVQVGIAQESATNIGAVVGAIFGGGNRGVQNTVIADANGYFASPVQIGAPDGSVLGVVITSTDPTYGVAATPVRFNLHVQ